MQFNLVNNKEQVVQFVWGGMALALGFISILGGLHAASVACACIISVRYFSVASLGSSGFGLLISVLRSLSTQSPFATQALIDF